MTTVDLTPITIGDTLITPSDFCAALRQRSLQEYQATVDRVVDYYLVLQACDRNGITASDAELQEAADDMRRQNGLSLAKDTNAWLKYKNLSVDDFEKSVEFSILVRKLMEHEYGGNAVADRFKADIHAYTWAALSVLSVASEGQAKDLAEQLRGNTASFASLARQHSAEPSTAGAGGMLGWTSLDKIPTALRGAVAASSGGGDIVGPVESGGTYHVVEVAAIEKPEYGPEFEHTAVKGLLTEWLAKERKQVSIDYPST